MTRRDFLSLFAASAAGYAFDLDRALWMPGQRTYFLPPEHTPVLGILRRASYTVNWNDVAKRWELGGLTIRGVPPEGDRV